MKPSKNDSSDRKTVALSRCRTQAHPILIEAIREFSLRQFQQMNFDMYQIPNDRDHDASAMVIWIGIHHTRVLKAIRHHYTLGKISQAEMLDRLSYHLSMAFSWCMGLANKMHIDVEEELWKHFPGVCPYCGGSTCCCNKAVKGRKNGRIENLTKFIRSNKRPETCTLFQQMFAVMFPQTLSEATSHFSEELGELGEVVQQYKGTHKASIRRKIIEELLDLITTIFAVATKNHLDIAVEMEKHFSRGCPGCFSLPCKNCKYLKE